MSNDDIIIQYNLDMIASARLGGSLTFSEAVILVLQEIPYGKVCGYGHIASLIGSPRAARQVGFVLRGLSPKQTNPQDEHALPWWRVIRSDGSIATKGDPMRPILQIELLKSEAIEVHEFKVSMQKYQWRTYINK